MNIVPDLYQSSEGVKKTLVCPMPDIFLPLGHPHHQWHHNDLAPKFLVEWWSQTAEHSNTVMSATYASVHLMHLISVHINSY